MAKILLVDAGWLVAASVSEESPDDDFLVPDRGSLWSVIDLNFSLAVLLDLKGVTLGLLQGLKSSIFMKHPLSLITRIYAPTQ